PVARRHVLPGVGGVEVLAPIGPQRGSVRNFAGKVRAIKLADQVADSGAAGRSPRITVDNQHPFLFGGALNRKFNQVGTLPLSRSISCRTERRTLGPVLKIGRIE